MRLASGAASGVASSSTRWRFRGFELEGGEEGREWARSAAWDIGWVMTAVVFGFKQSERHPLYIRRSNGWDNRIAHGVPM